MQQLIDLYKNSENLHHAYFFVAHKVDEVVADLKHFVEEHLGLSTAGNPDVSHHKFKTLTIDDARALGDSSSRKSLARTVLARKIFIIETDFITEEAQNALLKVFEEPTVGTHFFIVSPQDILLPTLRSRMHVVFEGQTLRIGAQRSDLGDSVLDMKLADRLALVKKITEDISDEKQTKQDAIGLLNQIELELYENGVEKSARALEICQSARASLYDRGAPIKMILENVMLSV